MSKWLCLETMLLHCLNWFYLFHMKHVSRTHCLNWFHLFHMKHVSRTWFKEKFIILTCSSYLQLVCWLISGLEIVDFHAISSWSKSLSLAWRQRNSPVQDTRLSIPFLERYVVDCLCRSLGFFTDHFSAILSLHGYFWAY